MHCGQLGTRLALFTNNFMQLNTFVIYQLLIAVSVTVADGIRGICTPDDIGPDQFFKHAGPGSVEILIPQSGHAQFWHAPPFLEWAYNMICGKGSNSGVMTIDTASALTTAWLLSEMNPSIPDVRCSDCVLNATPVTPPG